MLQKDPNPSVGEQFVAVTELAGDEVSSEQIHRLANRYYWAGEICRGKDVVEVACGTGQGLGYLAKRARHLVAGDYSARILEFARQHYGTRIDLRQFDAQQMPFADASQDVILIFEAIYYLPSVEKFVEECRRVLRPGGELLIVTANKDLFDFNPSPYSVRYYGVVELQDLLRRYGFQADLFGSTPVTQVSWRQKILRPVKKAAVELNLIPKSMAGKKLLKRLVFGRLSAMPAEITEGMAEVEIPVRLGREPDHLHKVIYCRARRE